MLLTEFGLQDLAPHYGAAQVGPGGVRRFLRGLRR